MQSVGGICEENISENWFRSQFLFVKYRDVSKGRRGVSEWRRADVATVASASVNLWHNYIIIQLMAREFPAKTAAARCRSQTKPITSLTFTKDRQINNSNIKRFCIVFIQVCRSWCAVAWHFEWTIWRQRYSYIRDLQRGQTIFFFLPSVFSSCCMFLTTPTVRRNFSRHEMILSGIAPQASKTMFNSTVSKTRQMEVSFRVIWITVCHQHLSYSMQSSFSFHWPTADHITCK